MSFVRKGVIILFALVAVMLLGGFILPSQVHVERQALIEASPEAVFAEISDFNQWEKWSPWANIDPDADFAVEGEGVGQKMTWASENPEVGSGTQQVTALDSPRLLKTHLDFGDMGVSDATFALEPTDGKTLVTWSLDADVRESVPLLNQPMSTYFGFFMDSMVGEQYEKGLANLKETLEG